MMLSCVAESPPTARGNPSPAEVFAPAAASVFDPVAVRRVLDDTIEGRRDGAYLILSIVLVELWLRRFIDRGFPSSRADPAARLEGCASGFSYIGGH